MAKVAKRVYSKIIPESCDRHANRIEIYKTSGHKYHVNFRNLQIRLSRKEFEEWKKGFAQALVKLGDRMEHDTLPEVKED